MTRRYLQPQVVVAFIWLLVLSASGPNEWRSAEAKTSVAVLPTGDGLELRYGNGEDKTTIPLYHVRDMRYFSAGVGLEERDADYPLFPLKMVFVVGAKPYLTHVAVRVVGESGAEQLTIPKEQVTGPWLFLDLPPGTYHVSATWAGKTQTNKVQIRKGLSNTIYLRWPEHTGH